jgi:hypothetical protein
MGMARTSQYEVALLLGARWTCRIARIHFAYYFQAYFYAMGLASRRQLL